MTTIKPVTIPRDVADAIESFRLKLYTNDKLALLAFRENGQVGRWTDGAQAVRDYAQANVDDFMSALINGYERELTEEEARHKAIVDEYEDYFYGVVQRGTEAEDYAYADGIVFTLNTLGIVIPGINDVEGGAA